MVRLFALTSGLAQPVILGARAAWWGNLYTAGFGYVYVGLKAHGAAYPAAAASSLFLFTAPPLLLGALSQFAVPWLVQRIMTAPLVRSVLATTTDLGRPLRAVQTELARSAPRLQRWVPSAQATHAWIVLSVQMVVHVAVSAAVSLYCVAAGRSAAAAILALPISKLSGREWVTAPLSLNGTLLCLVAVTAALLAIVAVFAMQVYYVAAFLPLLNVKLRNSRCDIHRMQGSANVVPLENLIRDIGRLGDGQAGIESVLERRFNIPIRRLRVQFGGVLAAAAGGGGAADDDDDDDDGGGGGGAAPNGMAGGLAAAGSFLLGVAAAAETVRSGVDWNGKIGEIKTAVRGEYKWVANLTADVAAPLHVTTAVDAIVVRVVEVPRVGPAKTVLTLTVPPFTIPRTGEVRLQVTATAYGSLLWPYLDAAADVLNSLGWTPNNILTSVTTLTTEGRARYRDALARRLLGYRAELEWCRGDRLAGHVVGQVLAPLLGHVAMPLFAFLDGVFIMPPGSFLAWLRRGGGGGGGGGVTTGQVLAWLIAATERTVHDLRAATPHFSALLPPLEEYRATAAAADPAAAVTHAQRITAQHGDMQAHARAADVAAANVAATIDALLLVLRRVNHDMGAGGVEAREEEAADAAPLPPVDLAAAAAAGPAHAAPDAAPAVAPADARPRPTVPAEELATQRPAALLVLALNKIQAMDVAARAAFRLGPRRRRQLAIPVGSALAARHAAALTTAERHSSRCKRVLMAAITPATVAGAVQLTPAVSVAERVAVLTVPPPAAAGGNGAQPAAAGGAAISLLSVDAATLSNILTIALFVAQGVASLLLEG